MANVNNGPANTVTVNTQAQMSGTANYSSTYTPVAADIVELTKASDNNDVGVPLSALASGVGALRPPGVPTLITPPIQNAAIFWDDFWCNTIAPANFGEGLVATPDTIANQTKFGNPQWQYSIIANTGTGGDCCNDNDGPTVAGTAGNFGHIRLVAGKSAGDGVCVETTGGQGNGQQNLTFSFGGTGINTVGMWRVGCTNGQSGKNIGYAWGWVDAGVTTGAGLNAIPADPDAAMAGLNGIIFYRNTKAYSTSAAGDITCRIYSVASGNTVLTLATAVPSVTFKKYEISSTAGVISVYCDGVLIGTAPASASVPCRPFGAIECVEASTVNPKLWLDCLYQEWAGSMAR